MTDNEYFSDLLELYLEKCGHSKREIKTFNLDTRLYHDLFIYGDIAESYIEVMAEDFNVDVSNFDFHAYFPVEFPGKTRVSGFLIALCPFWLRRRYLHPGENYKPLTLRMIQTALDSKKWDDQT